LWLSLTDAMNINQISLSKRGFIIFHGKVDYFKNHFRLVDILEGEEEMYTINEEQRKPEYIHFFWLLITSIKLWAFNKLLGVLYDVHFIRRIVSILYALT